MVLGREPAFWAAVARSAIALISALFINLTTDQQGALNAIVAAVLGVAVAISVRAEKALPLVVGLAEALIYVAVSFGWNMPPDKQTLIVGFVAAVVALVTRDRVVAPVNDAGQRV